MIESDLISNCWCIVSAEILSKQRAKPFSAKIFPRIIFAFLRQALFLIQLFLQDWHWQVAAITRLSSIFKQTTLKCDQISFTIARVIFHVQLNPGCDVRQL